MWPLQYQHATMQRDDWKPRGENDRSTQTGHSATIFINEGFVCINQNSPAATGNRKLPGHFRLEPQCMTGKNAGFLHFSAQLQHSGVRRMLLPKTRKNPATHFHFMLSFRVGPEHAFSAFVCHSLLARRSSQKTTLFTETTASVSNGRFSFYFRNITIQV